MVVTGSLQNAQSAGQHILRYGFTTYVYLDERSMIFIDLYIDMLLRRNILKSQEVT